MLGICDLCILPQLLPREYTVLRWSGIRAILDIITGVNEGLRSWDG